LQSKASELKIKTGAYDAEFEIDDDWGEDEFESESE